MTLRPELKNAASRLRIADVILKAIDASLVDDFFPDMEEELSGLGVQTMTPACRAITQVASEDLQRRRTVFEIFGGLRLIRQDPSGQRDLTEDQIEALVCANIGCVFLASFDEDVGEEGFLDEDALTSFAQHNAPFQIWPYWREVVQSACSRMGLPRVVLPTHRLRKSAALATSEIAKTERSERSKA
jgi:hypothetical protein